MDVDLQLHRSDKYIQWLSRYGGLDELGIQAACERHKEAKRKIWEVVRQMNFEAQ